MEFLKRLRKIFNVFSNRAIILMYHGVANVNSDPWSLSISPEKFEEQLEVLAKYYKPLKLSGLIEYLDMGKVPNKSVVVTFDDGYANNLYNAKPILEKYDVPATEFITTNYVGKRIEYWWDEIENIFLNTPVLPNILNLKVGDQLYNWNLEGDCYIDYSAYKNSYGNDYSHRESNSRKYVLQSIAKIMRFSMYETNENTLSQLRSWAGVDISCRSYKRILNEDELKLLAEDGLVDIGSHTVTHTVLSQLPDYLQREEIITSKIYLEQLMDKNINCFAYPNGKNKHFNHDSVSIVKQAGYECACTAISGLTNLDTTDNYRLPRIMVNDCDGEQFLKNLEQWFSDS